MNGGTMPDRNDQDESLTQESVETGGHIPEFEIEAKGRLNLATQDDDFVISSEAVAPTKLFAFDLQNILKRSLPLVIVLIALGLPIPNAIKAIVFLLSTAIFFGPIGVKEAAIYYISSFVLVLSDIGAIKNGFFQFGQPDLAGLPYWEFVAWGFWIMFGYKNLPKEFPNRLDWRVVVCAIGFSVSFSLIENRLALLLISAGIIAGVVWILNDKNNIYYLLLFATMGIAVEVVGLSYHLWSYSNADLSLAVAQFLVMWVGIGIFFRNLAGPFLLSKIERGVGCDD
jgi:hypothetical protein